MRSQALIAALFMVSVAVLVSCGSSSKPSDASVTQTATDAGTPSGVGTPSGDGAPTGSGSPSGVGTPTESGTSSTGATPSGGGTPSDEGAASGSGTPPGGGGTPGDEGPTPVQPGKTLWSWTSGLAGWDSSTGIFPGPGGTSYLSIHGNGICASGLLFAALGASGQTMWARAYGSEADLTACSSQPGESPVLSGTSDGHVIAGLVHPHDIRGLADVVELAPGGGLLRVLLTPAANVVNTDNTWTSVGEMFVLTWDGTADHPIIHKLRADGSEIWHRDLDLGSVGALVGTPDGGAYAILFDARQIVLLAADGTTRWVRPVLPGSSFGQARSLKDGALAAVRSFESFADRAQRTAQGTSVRTIPGPSPIWRHELFILEPDDGRERGSIELPGHAFPIVGALPDGGVVAVTAEEGMGCPVLRAYSAWLGPLWTRSVDLACSSPPVSTTVSGSSGLGLVPTNDGRLLITGTLSGHADFGDSHVVDPVGGSDAFVIEIDPR